MQICSRASPARERSMIFNRIVLLEEIYGLRYAGTSAFSPDVQAYRNAA